ncbi:OLC1v1035006C1 [Oldenlandia corymbosa var. corymbosa]|uniref:OLC1v1035006C1 n=1 Tax=Oldenlandia corymbosa var. corymbosa TaxID=529605 RepID=A0AAV1CRW8_OLDCO|nr:OLC1v1035006C1 [Oldenlandia corymbosa var. corymbosa]
MALHTNFGSPFVLILTAITFLFVFQQSSAVSATSNSTSTPPKGIVLRVTKDPATLQYITLVHQRTPLVPIKLAVDLGGGSLWVSCGAEDHYVSSSFSHVDCTSTLCPLARGTPDCADHCVFHQIHLPNCTTTACWSFTFNPFGGKLDADGEIIQDVLVFRSTSPGGKAVSAPNFVFTCVPSPFKGALAPGVKGVAGLGSAYPALPSQLGRIFNFPSNFLVCLSSSTKANAGAVVFGDLGRFPALVNDDMYKSMINTPIIKSPFGNATPLGREFTEYYVGLTSIKVNGKVVPINATLLSIDELQGYGGTKISTAHPYTVVERSIYQAVVKAFVEKLPSTVTRITPPVEPFGECFKGINNLNSVPSIDFVFQNKKIAWRISGSNSMARINKDVTCLAIVELATFISPSPELEFERESAITIGAHQMEEHLLVFDLQSSMIGISPSLVSRKTTCANFNSKY